jgi:hypothetical protein
MEDFLYLENYSNEDYPDFNQILKSSNSKDSIFYSCVVALLQIIVRGQNQNYSYSESVRETFQKALNMKTEYSDDPIIIESNQAMKNAISVLSNNEYRRSVLMNWLWQYFLPGEYSLSTYLMFALKNLFFGIIPNIGAGLHTTLANSKPISSEEGTEILMKISRHFGVFIELVDRKKKITEIRESSNSLLPRITIFQVEDDLYCLGIHSILREFDENDKSELNLIEPPFTFASLDESMVSNLSINTKKTAEKRIVPSYDLPLTTADDSFNKVPMVKPQVLLHDNRSISPHLKSLKTSNHSFLPFKDTELKGISEKNCENEDFVENFSITSQILTDPVQYHLHQLTSIAMNFSEQSSTMQKSIKRGKLTVIEGTDPEFERIYQERLKSKDDESPEGLNQYSQNCDFYELMVHASNLLSISKNLEFPKSANVNKIKEICDRNLEKINSEISIRKKMKIDPLLCLNCNELNNTEDFKTFECGWKCRICIQCRKKQSTSYCNLCNRKFTEYEINVLKTIKT